MPTVIQGFQILTKPADTQNESFPILITVPAAAPGNLRIITFPTEFNAIAISLQIENQDGTNAASYRVNSSTDPLVNLPSSTFRSFFFYEYYICNRSTRSGRPYNYIRSDGSDAKK